MNRMNPNGKRTTVLFLSGAGFLGVGMAGLLALPHSFAQDTNPPQPPAKEQGGKRRGPGGPGGPGGRHQGPPPVEAFAAELGLTDAQKQQLQAIHEEFRKQMEALHEARKQQTQAVLTAEQKAKLAELMEQRREMGPPRGPGRGPGVPPHTPEEQVSRMTEHLSLTADQASQILGILKQSRANQEALHTAAQQPNADRQAIHEQMRALHESTRSQISAVLTDEQRAKFNQRGPGRPGGPEGRPGGPGRRGGGRGVAQPAQS